MEECTLLPLIGVAAVAKVLTSGFKLVLVDHVLLCLGKGFSSPPLSQPKLRGTQYWRPQVPQEACGSFSNRLDLVSSAAAVKTAGLSFLSLTEIFAAPGIIMGKLSKSH